MANFSVNYASLSSGSEGVQAVARRLNELLEEIEAAQVKVLEGWTGEAKQAFDVNMRVVRQELIKLSSVSQAFGNALNNTGIGYMNADRAGRHSMEA
ncbi:WXG100 family type VII secretion target [Streptomyces xiamenensis]|uniref:WXG100 family type VII secretion target n=1 Tax=Streptomyces xiamenensis TaxID=408015 RepID=UPI0035DC46A2